MNIFGDSVALCHILNAKTLQQVERHLYIAVHALRRTYKCLTQLLDTIGLISPYRQHDYGLEGRTVCTACIQRLSQVLITLQSYAGVLQVRI